MRYTIPIVALALSVLATGARAQYDEDDSWKFEVRPFLGAWVPVGAQRDVFNTRGLIGVQLATEVRPTLHVVGAVGYTLSQARYAVRDRDVHVTQYDLGLELGRVRQLNLDWEFRPFLGLGAGARTYRYESDALQDGTCGAAYGALGTEFQLWRTAIRLEGRDNIYCYRAPFAGAKSRTRSDLALTLGLAYHFR